MEDLLADVTEIRFAAERAGEEIAGFEEMPEETQEQLNDLLAFIANLAENIEDFLLEYQGDKSAELEVGFRMSEGLDPWSLFGDKPE